MLEHGADLGIALDGDADRVDIDLHRLHGELIDGDQILALIGGSWADSGRAEAVATVMSNLGLERFTRRTRSWRCTVRQVSATCYVAEKMRETAINVGGEQSGHLILSDFATTGDGLVAALQVLAVIVEQNRPASEVCRVFAPLRNCCATCASPAPRRCATRGSSRRSAPLRAI